MIGGVFLALAAAPVVAHAQSAEAREALWSGRYEEAIQAWEMLDRQGNATAADMRGLLVAYMRVGQYERAIEVGREYVEKSPATASDVLSAASPCFRSVMSVRMATCCVIRPVSSLNGTIVVSTQ